MKKINLGFIGTNPNFDGGMSVYQKNLIKYIQKKRKDIDMTWVYTGKENKEYVKDGVKYVELRNKWPYPVDQIIDSFKFLKYLKGNTFDIINSHAVYGYWMQFYNKQSQKLINTYHGTTYGFFACHLKRYNFLMKILVSPTLAFGYLIEKPPIKKADKIICVSNKVKRELEEIYNTDRKFDVLRTGVDLSDFKIRDKNEVRKKLKLDKDKTYGLYIGQGGYWRKGLDRAVKISEEFYKKDKNYRLIVVAADYKKVKNIIDDKEYLIYFERVPREDIPFYYNASDFFFCFSRYEGGAPIMVTSEAMASGSLVICSKDSEQEILKDGKNCLVIENFDEKDADKILKVVKDKNKKDKIIKDSIKTIKELSLEKWGEKYLKILLK